jgi:hypothetical protein
MTSLPPPTRVELLTRERQLEVLTLELQQPIVTSPRLRGVQEGMGGDKLPEPRLGIRIVGWRWGWLRLLLRARPS